MLPSRRLIILVACAAPLLLAGAVFAPFTVLGLAYVALLLAYAVLDVLLLPSRRRIAVTRLVPERVSLGAPARIAFEITNGTHRRAEVRLAEDLAEGLDAEPEECAGLFEAGESGVLSYRLTARTRGRHGLSAVDVRVLPAMGLFYRQFRLEMPAEVHVFPNLANLRRYELLVRRGLTHEQGVARQRQIGQGSEFESLRLYAAGDEMTRIDWKATARRSRLIVRDYQPERQQSVLVAIDVGRATAGEFGGLSRLDYLVNAALMLAYVALRQGDWFSLVAFSDHIESYLPPVRQLRSIDRVARTLYELEPRLVEADYAAACRFLSLKNRKRSLVCLMTDVLDRDASGIIIASRARFARHHLPLAVTLANPEVRGVADAPLAQTSDPYAKAAALDVLAAREEALAAMRHRGIGVLDVHPDELTPELINRYLMIKSTGHL
jgi:uncharacterized protein (DUF58 family)